MIQRLGLVVAEQPFRPTIGSLPENAVHGNGQGLVRRRQARADQTSSPRRRLRANQLGDTIREAAKEYGVQIQADNFGTACSPPHD
jgi:hypothetical protein